VPAGCGVRPRRPVPKSCPWALSVEVEQRILEARARTNWGPMRLAALTGRHRATVWKVLKRHGVSRRRRGQRQTFKRFESSQPGALLHIDAYRAPKFLAPGHRVTGDREESARTRTHVTPRSHARTSKTSGAGGSRRAAASSRGGSGASGGAASAAHGSSSQASALASHASAPPAPTAPQATAASASSARGSGGSASSEFGFEGP
jgi:hypothetical protein